MDGIGLGQQYAQTLQNTIGLSQRERNKRLAQQASQNANTPTQWSERGASGYRGAGFNELESVPTLDTNTLGSLGNYVSNYVEGGKSQAGYYGADNPYTESGAANIFNKAGYKQAAGSPDAAYQAAGFTLPSAYNKTYYKDYDFTQKSGVDDYLKTQGWSNLGSGIDTSLVGLFPQLSGNLSTLKEDVYAKNGVDPRNYKLEDSSWYKDQIAQQQTQQTLADVILQDKSYLYNMYDINKLPQGKALMEAGGPDAYRATTQAKIDQAKKYIISGFVPGNNVGSYSWHQNAGKSAITYGPDSGYWSKNGTNDPGIMWDATRGYTTVQPMDESAAMRDSIKTVGSVIGGVVLPGLGTSWMGLANNALESAGFNLPSISTTSLGLPTGIANMTDRVLTAGGMGGLSSLLSGGNFVTGALRSGLSNLVGQGVNNITGDLGKYLTDAGVPTTVANTLKDFAGGAGTGLTQNLLNKNTGQGNLEAALSSGIGRTLGGLYNTMSSTTDQQDKSQNYKTAATLSNLFTRVRKT